MTLPRTLPLLACFLLGQTGPVPAQDSHAHHGAPGDKVGQVDFSISCNPEAQARFQRAVALLHSFWWSEAQKAFDSVSEADPRCAMAHWGSALVHRGNWFAGPPSPEALEAGRAAAEKASALSPQGGREAGYVAAVMTFYRDASTRDHRTRSLAYEDAMRRLHEEFPDDLEAAVFYALAVTANASPTDKSFERQKRAGAILGRLFEQRPDHPGLAHYLIHTYDAPPIAHLGVDAARRYAEIAPSVPHAQHMPSHIFTRLGMWDASIQTNRASAEAALAYERAQQSSAMSFDRAHALDYLAYAYLQKGQDQRAEQVLEEVRSATAVPSVATDYAFAAIPARFVLERGRWADAVRLPVRPSPQFPAGEAITHFARGIGAARTGDLASARAAVEALAAIRDELQRRQEAYWGPIVEAQRLAVAGWIAHSEGDKDAAVAMLASAADMEEQLDKHPVTPGPILPARELQGDLLMELNRPAEALRAYEAALKQEQNRARTAYGAARAAERAGDPATARKYYESYVQLMAEAEAERPELRTARAFVAGGG